MNKNRFSQFFNYAISLMLVAMTVFLSGCGASVGAGPPDEVLYVNRLWTTVGSAGIVDEKDVKKVYFEHSAAQMGQSIDGNHTVALTVSQTESATIRYNVTPADALFELRKPCKDGKDTTGFGCPGIGLEVRYLATGLDARVVVKLIEVNMATGFEVNRLTFSSNAFPAADEYQVQRMDQCSPPPSWLFDFKHKAYYIEVTLIHSAVVTGSVAGVQMIKITNDCPTTSE